MTDQLVVTSQSGQRIEWSHLSKHEGNLLVGMMGCAIGVGMGLALALPHRKVIVLDSDGSVLLSLFNLATLGNLQPEEFSDLCFRQRRLQRQPHQLSDGHRRQHRFSGDGARRGNQECARRFATSRSSRIKASKRWRGTSWLSSFAKSKRA